MTLLARMPDAALVLAERVLEIAPVTTYGWRLAIWIEQVRRATIRDVAPDSDRWLGV